MRQLDTLIPPDTDAAGLRKYIDDLERRRINSPTFQVTDGTYTYGVFDLLKLLGGGVALTSSGNGVTATFPTIVSSTYTPTITNGANVASSTARVTQYIQIGSNVIVFGSVNIDPTSATTNTVFDISLPVASNLTTAWQAAGFIGKSLGTANSDFGVIVPETSNDRVTCNYYPSSALAQDVYFIFGYAVA